MTEIEEIIQLQLKNNTLELKNSENDYNELRNKLALKIADMISTDFAGLLNALYRIDVNEQKLKLIIAETLPENVPLKMAEMIIERIIQKMEYRKKYGS
jgi:hypothetical protein